jgi:hypothetical protein
VIASPGDKVHRCRWLGRGGQGSLAGTFLSALLLIPFVGTRRTFLIFALALALAAATGLRRRYLLASARLGVLLLLPAGYVKAGGTDRGHVIYETETPYQYARVVQEPHGKRRHELNEGVAVHSLFVPGRYLTGNYWDDFLVLPRAVLGHPPRRVAILGNAAGTVARAYGHYYPATRVDAVEIDGPTFRSTSPRTSSSPSPAAGSRRAAWCSSMWVTRGRQPP